MCPLLFYCSWEAFVRASRVSMASRHSYLGDSLSISLESLHALRLPQHAVPDAPGIDRRALLVRELVEVREELLDLPLDGYQQPDIPRQKVRRSAAFLRPMLVGSHAQVRDQCPARHFTGGDRNVALTADGETEFPGVP